METFDEKISDSTGFSKEIAVEDDTKIVKSRVSRFSHVKLEASDES